MHDFIHVAAAIVVLISIVAVIISVVDKILDGYDAILYAISRLAVRYLGRWRYVIYWISLVVVVGGSWLIVLHKGGQ